MHTRGLIKSNRIPDFFYGERAYNAFSKQSKRTPNNYSGVLAFTSGTPSTNFRLAESQMTNRKRTKSLDVEYGSLHTPFGQPLFLEIFRSSFTWIPPPRTYVPRGFLRRLLPRTYVPRRQLQQHEKDRAFPEKRQLTSRTYNGKVRATHNRQITPKIVLSRIREVLWAKLSWPTCVRGLLSYESCLPSPVSVCIDS